MSRDYPGRVRRRTILVGTALSLVTIAVLVGLTAWLRIEATGTALPAPAEPSDTAPGALACPEPSALVAGEPVQVSAGDLIDCPDIYDTREVIYTGEVIGTVFVRGGRPVAVLNDDDYALGAGPIPQTRTALGGNAGMTVLLPPGSTDQLGHVGDYDARGDLVRVIGNFTAANRHLQGAPAIDARTAEVTQLGGPISHPVSPRTVTAALLAAATAAGATWMARRDPGFRPPP